MEMENYLSDSSESTDSFHSADSSQENKSKKDYPWKIYHKRFYEKHKNTKIICPICNLTYTYNNKTNHLRSKKHLEKT
jgi:uncharacterized phage infection (PIP) family protein YhgE